jgi:hypothetical protein
MMIGRAARIDHDTVVRKWFIKVPDSTLDDRFRELRQMVDQEVSRAREGVIQEIGRAVSRIRSAKDEAEWHEAVLDSGRAFASEPAALELLASLAAMTAPATAPASPISNGVVAPLSANAPAQRFARVKIAGIQLYHADAVKAGRVSRDLYGSLQPHIDAARDAFRETFLSNGIAIADYLHAEMVHALANDDATLLGPNYPGPLA